VSDSRAGEPALALAVAVWALINAVSWSKLASANGRVISLALGLAGFGAIIVMGTLWRDALDNPALLAASTTIVHTTSLSADAATRDAIRRRAFRHRHGCS